MVGNDPTLSEPDSGTRFNPKWTSSLTVCGCVLAARNAGDLDKKTVIGPRFMFDNIRKQVPHHGLGTWAIFRDEG